VGIKLSGLTINTDIIAYDIVPIPLKHIIRLVT